MSKLRIGIFGLNRGYYYISSILWSGAEVVAICDKDKRFCQGIEDMVGHSVPYFDNFDDFIKAPMDCVLLANYFHEHTPYAVRCLEMGIHVISECTAGSTMAECVQLVRSAEKSKARYFLVENYPYMQFCLEMKNVYRSGRLGRCMFAEGEYNHPGSAYYSGNNIAGLKYLLSLHDSPKHWRNYLPATYYITHSLAPLMLATGAFPTRVTASAIYMLGASDGDIPSHNGDKTAIIMTSNSDGSVFRVTGCAAFGGAEDSYRICGTKGQIENIRGGGGKVMLRYNAWETPEGGKETDCYMPTIYERDSDYDRITHTAHGGSDFMVMREIIDCIKSGRKFEMDEYFAATMSAVAILAHRSILCGGVPFDVPDLRLESERKKWESDSQTPFCYSDGREPNIPCCSHPEYRPTKEQLEHFEAWRGRFESGEFDEVERIKGY